MPDRLFTDPRLAAVYDDLEGDRPDLDHYEAIVFELGASRVLDVGCGTGVFALRSARAGITMVGLDPARASLEVARRRDPGAAVTWLHGDVAGLPALEVDAATMTGNVAQVFLTDHEWRATLTGVRDALRPGGHLVFESRDPAARAWEEWAGSRTRRRTAVGPVERSTEVTRVELPFVSFRLTFRFLDDGTELTSDSTLRFRDRVELEASLDAAGYDVLEVRDAPDRPGRELVVIARVRTSS